MTATQITIPVDIPQHFPLRELKHKLTTYARFLVAQNTKQPENLVVAEEHSWNNYKLSPEISALLPKGEHYVSEDIDNNISDYLQEKYQ